MNIDDLEIEDLHGQPRNEEYDEREYEDEPEEVERAELDYDDEVPPAAFTLDDMFDDDDFALLADNDTLNDMLNEQVDDEFGTIEMFDPSSIFDVLGSFDRTASGKPPFKRLLQPDFNISPFEIKSKSTLLQYEYVDGPRYLIGENNIIKIVNANQSVNVGVCKVDFLAIPIAEDDYFAIATMLSEEASTKATCLGYSSFIHSVASIIVNQRSGVIEPIEGWDVQAHGIGWEITGLNYLKRKTLARCIINKYALVSSTCKLSPENHVFLKYSHHEDICDTSQFNKSAFDQDESPYTYFADIMHNITRDFPMHVYENLSKQFKSWYSRQDVSQSTKFDYVSPAAHLTSVITQYSKTINGVKYVPCPFRVLGGEVTDNDMMNKFIIRPYTDIASVGTTFHTMPLDTNPEVTMLSQTAHNMVHPKYPRDNISTWLMRRLCRFDVFRSAVIESELFAKISGKYGMYWSKFSNCGISWKIVRAESLTYYCAFHQIGEPPLSCGKWRKLHPEGRTWQSATFKISISDIEYAKLIPSRIMTMICSMFAYTSKQTRLYVLQKMVLITGIMKGSSWQTSALLGDMRFMSLCAVSGSGDVASMITKAANRVNKFLSFSDFYALFLIRRFSERYDGNGLKDTPLFQMPIRFLGIEKDMNMYTMWHVRGLTHATNCFIKLRDGAQLERANRVKLSTHYNRQVDTLMNMSAYGLQQYEFDNLMDYSPDTAYFNYFLFASLTYLSAKKLHAGKRQMPTKVCINNLFSDHHSYMSEDPADPRNGKISTMRVTEGVTKILHDYGQPGGIHSLLHRMSAGGRIRNVYLTHPKDSKSKNREIPQMSSHMRITQFVSESLLTIYTDEESADMMQNPEKFSIYATRFSEIMRNHGLTRSEDKEFFCGNMHPEFMSVGIGLLARVLGSTSVVLSAALLRCDKSRINISPIGCDESILETHYPITGYNIVVGNKLKERSGIENFIHMQQGVRAIAAACINTIFTTGLDIVQRIVAPDITDTQVMTTSDDAVRGAFVKKPCTYDIPSTLDDYIFTPPKLMKHSMMIDSADKGIVSSRLAEFNNTVCGPNGLIPQHFAHAHLVIQPLMGENVIDDIQSIISRARSSLSWGDSFDTCRSAYSTGVILLMQKWFLRIEEIDLLYDAGLLPFSDEELLVGVTKISFNSKLALIRAMEPEIREEVAAGRINILTGLRKFNVKDGSKRRTIYAKSDTNINAVQRTIGKINAARRTRGSLKPDFARKPSHKKYAAVKDELITMLRNSAQDPTIEETNLINRFVNPPEVRIIPREPKRSDSAPCVQGATVKTGDDVDLKLVKAFRFCKLNVSRMLSKKEMEIAMMGPLEYEKELNFRDINNRDFGIRFKSPTGRPLIRLYNDVKFIRPQTFTFSLLLPEPGERQHMWTMKGEVYPSFQPTWWGQNTVTRCVKSKYIMAFGFAIAGNKLHVFYQTLTSVPMMYTTTKFDPNAKVFQVSVREGNLYCPLMKDYAPIHQDYVKDMYKYLNYFHVGMDGYATALMNYGNYLNTSQRSASTIMTEIFGLANSRFPNSVLNHKPDYPYFIEGCTTFPDARLTTIIGVNFITKLKLTYSENPDLTRTINVDVDPPYETTQLPVEEANDW